jgi:hypothetical protein
MKIRRSATLALLAVLASGLVNTVEASATRETLFSLHIDAPSCACDTGYDVVVEYSVSGEAVDGVLEVYEDGVLVRALALQAFLGSAREVVHVPSDTEAEHTWRAVLIVPGQSGAAQAEDTDTMQVCETPRLSGVPDQTWPFQAFNLHDFLSYAGNRTLRFSVGAPDPPPPGWEISISSDGTINVYTPDYTPYSMDLTFWAWVECGVGVTCGDSDTASFLSVPPPPACPEDAAIDVEASVNGQDADTPPGIEVPQGSTLHWTYEVTNRGQVSLERVIVADHRSGTVCTFPALGPGEHRTCLTSTAAGFGTNLHRAKAGGLCAAADGGKRAVTDIDLTNYRGVPD